MSMVADKQSVFNQLSLLSPHSLYQQQQQQQQQQHQQQSQQQQHQSYNDLSSSSSYPNPQIRQQWPPAPPTQPSSASQTRPSSAHHIANLAANSSPPLPTQLDPNSFLFNPHSLNSPSHTRPSTQPPQPTANWLNQPTLAALARGGFDSLSQQSKDVLSMLGMGQQQQQQQAVLGGSSSTNALNALLRGSSHSGGSNGGEMKQFGLELSGLGLNALTGLNGLPNLHALLNNSGSQHANALMMQGGDNGYNGSPLVTQAYEYNKPQQQSQQQQQQQHNSFAQLQQLLQNTAAGNGAPTLSDLLALNNPSASSNFMSQLAQMKQLIPNFQGLALQMQQQYTSALPLPALNGLSSLGMGGLNQSSSAMAAQLASQQGASNVLSGMPSGGVLGSVASLSGVSGLGGLDNQTYACTHTGCGQLLKSRFSLKRHMKKHTGEKPHLCPFKSCHRKFSETTALKRHARIHTGEKPYKCGFADCTKTFADATNVKRHEMTHTGEKPYKCLYGGCGRCFSRRSSLRTHMISLHNIRPDSPLIAASLARRSKVPIDLSTLGGGVVSAAVIAGTGGKGIKREREESSGSSSSEQSHVSSPSGPHDEIVPLL